MTPRVERLRSRLAQDSLDAILITQAENRRYLSGFTGSAGHLLISRDRAILATDFRYIEQGHAEAPDFDILRIQGLASSWLPALLSGSEIARLGFEAREMSYRGYKEIAEAAGDIGTLSLVSTDGVVEAQRALKDDAELNRLERAAELADRALEEVLPEVGPGISERALAWKLESHMRGNGSEPLPFDIIVASGPNSALPHARPSDREIGPNEPVIIDLGAKADGYCSDVSRTICLDGGDGTFNRIYDIVLGAQLTAMATLQEGMSGEQVDQLARTVIAQAGYGDNFGHGLGHGVGLAAHEEPRLGSGSSDILVDSMVFTIEPGIYLSGWGGVRIEDTVVLEKGRLRQLTKAKKTRR
jgi:Xaa-Pro aminopeptidase